MGSSAIYLNKLTQAAIAILCKMVAMIDEHDDSPEVHLNRSQDLYADAASSVENLYKEGVLDPVYHAKTLVLNRALQEIGMGKYQVCINLRVYGPEPQLTRHPQVHAPCGGRHGMVRVSHVKHRRVSFSLTDGGYLRDSVWPVSRTQFWSPLNCIPNHHQHFLSIVDHRLDPYPCDQ